MVVIKIAVIRLCLALSVGFYTLLERKFLSYIQIRKGPNKVSFGGIPQPLSDAAKLFVKETVKISLSINLSYYLSPNLAIVIILLLWSLYASNSMVVVLKLGVLFFLCVSRLNVFVVLVSGWSSNRKYALLGATRGVAQTISYEVSMSLILLTIIIRKISFDWYELSDYFLIFLPIVFVLWFIRCLRETNRAPFDLAEGESELVSGFNIEYGRANFAFLFIAEYGGVLFLRIITSAIFLNSWLFSLGLGVFMWTLVSILFLWVRGTYPRIRYDKLMRLTWKSFLTLVLALGCVLL